MIHSAAEEKRAAARLALGLAYITARERIAIELYCQGETPRTIAPVMRIDPRTVEALMRNARDRTGARTNCQLTAMYAASQPIRGRGRSSNRDDSSARETTVRAPNCVDALSSTSIPELPRNRVL